MFSTRCALCKGRILSVARGVYSHPRDPRAMPTECVSGLSTTMPFRAYDLQVFNNRRRCPSVASALDGTPLAAPSTGIEGGVWPSTAAGTPRTERRDTPPSPVQGQALMGGKPPIPPFATCGCSILEHRSDPQPTTNEDRLVV